MEIRFATANDCKALLAIYAEYIDTPITFEYKLPPDQEFADRITNIIKNYPYLICEENNKVIGYAHANKSMKDDAYGWNAELSIYLGKSFTSKGLGKRLYNILIEILKLQGVKTVYGGVTVPNLKSERLHTSLGFQLIGIHHKTGYKCEEWHDVVWFEKQIAPYDCLPKQIIAISQIPKEILCKIIKQ